MEKSDLETAAEFDKNGDHEQALVYYMKALDERKAALGEKHPDVAALYTTIGRALNDQEDYDNAVSYYEKALEIPPGSLQGILPANGCSMRNHRQHTGGYQVSATGPWLIMKTHWMPAREHTGNTILA